jgi:maleylpyruvate isomerase
MTEGHRYFMLRLAQIGDAELSEPSALPGWTGRHVLSHVGHNARALRRLAHWAATGEPTPMYATPTARASEIARDATRDPQQLRAFVQDEQRELADALEGLDDDQLAAEVVTAQGRHLPAAALPWLRARELWIHAVDLHRESDFSDFPPGLIDELIVEVLAWRRDVRGERLRVRATDRDRVPSIDEAAASEWIDGRAADLARWLTGRGSEHIQTSGRSALPSLSAWLGNSQPSPRS